MIVISRNGRTVVYRGWQAWLLGTVMLAAAWLIFALLAALWIGAAITIGFALLLIVPAALVAGLIASLFNRRSG